MVDAESAPDPEDGYEPEFRAKVVDLGADGYSLAEIAAALDVPRARIHSWMEHRPDFREAMVLAGDKAFAWWERKAREGLEQGTKINTTIWSKSIGARFPAEAYGERGANSGEGRASPDQKRSARTLTARDRAKMIALVIAKHRAQSV